MHEIALFVEDQAHYEFLKALIHRLEREHSIEVELTWQNVRRGHGMVIRELRQYLRDLQRGHGGFPDLVIVATDANCKGRAEKLREITEITGKVTARVICAIPNPHIERWLLLDSAAFKSVFDRGCDVPDQKCERRRYKKMLMDAILQAGISPSLGGIEFADEIVDAMDLERTAQADDSLGHFIMKLQAVFQGWRQ